MIAQISPLALIDSHDKIGLAVAFSLLALVAFLIWLLPPTFWLAPPAPQCPLCESKDVRPSKASGLRDQIGLMLQRRPYRCRSCWVRFSVKSLPSRPKLHA